MDFWDLLSTYGPVAGPVALAIMGIVVTVLPRAAAGPWAGAWIGAFTVVALLTAVGTYISQRGLEAEITGGDNYPLFMVAFGGGFLDPSSTPGQFPLRIMNGGHRPLFEVSAQIRRAPPPNHQQAELLDSLRHPIGTLHYTMLPAGFAMTGISLPAGTYPIDIVAKNGAFYELLEIPPSGPAEQTWRLWRFGSGKVLDCRPLPQCMDSGVPDGTAGFPAFAPGL
jgi:hypothetical protein